MGIEKARSSENLQALSFVISVALGGHKPKAQPIQSWREAEAAFGEVFGGKAESAVMPNGADAFAGLDEVFGKLK